MLAGPVRGTGASKPADGSILVLVIDASAVRAPTPMSGTSALASRWRASGGALSPGSGGEGEPRGAGRLRRSAFTLCPLPSDGALLWWALARVEAGVAGEATALGEGAALAVETRRGAGEPPGAS